MARSYGHSGESGLRNILQKKNMLVGAEIVAHGPTGRTRHHELQKKNVK
jgi:hypothetical protein